ncbi:putative histidyl-tRNA mitochondrial precursor [Rosellinia necatrix]|uniref:histidine--tRNA ligase n=1 Tax=Rosellinia necatrix TaxID=77044 RepID=A0A1W2TS43_ROSNE|nr:putative histidyl-tRNA mitochondrial precursor [Rosellinia necatrix]
MRLQVLQPARPLPSHLCRMVTSCCQFSQRQPYPLTINNPTNLCRFRQLPQASSLPSTRRYCSAPSSPPNEAANTFREMEKTDRASVKVPKGTRDWVGADIKIRDHIFKAAGDAFTRHGGVALDTPVFELKNILSGKYGEDSKLIYELADQGGEDLALRYDLTVPFARWLAMNSVQQIKRYHIAKVYRRDQPAIARGRMREFYQCDFDIAGEYDSMIPDAEILRIINEVFTSLGLAKDVTVKINHRKILDGLFEVAGVPDDKIRTISSAVDKLDKLSREEVKKEMIEKGLKDTVADEILEWTKYSGNIPKIIELLQNDEKMLANEKIKKGIEEMSLLQTYLKAFQIADQVSFDLALARGLDYYTGLIYEAVIELTAKDRSAETRVGSIAAGGRYDNLVGMYGRKQIPCIGISFGVDRIFTILKSRHEKEKQRVRGSDVYVMVFGGKNGLLPERMEIASMLWDAGLSAEFSPKVKPRLPQQFKAAETAGTPLAVIIGEDELKAGKVRVKVMGLPDGHPDKEGKLIEKTDLTAECKKLLAEESQRTNGDTTST